MPVHLSLEEAHSELGTSTGDSLDAVKSSYRKLALQWHPDKNENSEESTQKFQRISAAWDRIANPPKEPEFPSFGESGGGRGFPSGMFFGGGGFFFSGGGFGYGGPFGGGRRGYYDDEYDEYSDEYMDDEDYPEADEESDADYDDYARFVFEDILGGGYGTRRSYNAFRSHTHHKFTARDEPPESPEERAERMKAEAERVRKVEERRKNEAQWAKEEREKAREEEIRAGSQRRSDKKAAQSAAKSAAAFAAAGQALKRLQLSQLKRSAVFAALRKGEVDVAKRGIFEENVDAAGSEWLAGGREAVAQLSPEDLATLQEELAGGAAKTAPTGGKGKKGKGKKAKKQSAQEDGDAFWKELGVEASQKKSGAAKATQRQAQTQSKPSPATPRKAPAPIVSPPNHDADDDDLPLLVDADGDAKDDGGAESDNDKSKQKRLKKKKAAAKNAASAAPAAAADSDDDMPPLVDMDTAPSPTLVGEDEGHDAKPSTASRKKKNKKKKKPSQPDSAAVPPTELDTDKPSSPAEPAPSAALPGPATPAKPSRSAGPSPDKQSETSPQSAGRNPQPLQYDPKETLLHLAARQGFADFVEWLVDHGANAEERDSMRTTAFHQALFVGHNDIVAYFLEASAPPFPAPHGGDIAQHSPDVYYPLPKGQHSLLGLSLAGAHTKHKGATEAWEAMKLVLPFAEAHDLKDIWHKVEHEQKRAKKEKEVWEEMKWSLAERAKDLEFDGFEPPAEYLRRRRVRV
ncbi:hypothetical protein JCM11641_002373 [Rhodosporidiobolus odoratus]